MPCGQPSCHRPDTLVSLGKNSKQYLSYESPEKLTWCSGCGDYGIRNSTFRAMALEGLKQEDLLLCYDVGCNGNGADKIRATTIHGLHGRVISLAAGAAIANPRLKVIASAGDGATFSEGVNHLVHAIRNNYPMVFLLHNNENYGLTTGQPSSMTRKGYPMTAAPDGVNAEPVNACAFALGLQPTFVARTFSGDLNHMTEVMRAGLQHPGFAFIEVMQVCTTYNHATPQEWYWERIRPVEEAIPGYDPTNLEAAKKAAADMNDKIMTGVLYRDTKSVPFLGRQVPRKGKKTTLVEEVGHFDVGSLMRDFL